MSLTLSPQVRLIAVLGLAAVVATAAGAFLLMRGGSSEPASEGSDLTLPATHRATPGPPASAETPEAAAPPADRLPAPLVRALRRHEVVVVSLFVPGARVDRLAVGEARAGAERARAGFVALNALDQRQGGTLARLLGVLDPPAVLVFRNPDTLLFQIDGFADLQTVAQAAANARP